MKKKYQLTNETKHLDNGIVLHRIEALVDFNDVKKGDKGGWIEKESNLSQEGDCWIYDDAKVCDDALVKSKAVVKDNALVCGKAKVMGKAVVRGKAVVCVNAGVGNDALVCDNAWVSGNAKVWDNAVVKDNASVCGNAMLYGNALVCDNAWVSGDAEICGDAIIKKMGDYIVFQNWWSSGRFFTYTKSNKMWKVGCFYGTGEELVKKAYADGEDKGKMYELYVSTVEKRLEIMQK